MHFKTITKLIVPAFFAATAFNANALTLNSSTINGVSEYLSADTFRFGDGTAHTFAWNGAHAFIDQSTKESFWGYCIDPLSWINVPSSYTTLSLNTYLTDTTANTNNYTNLFSSAQYQDLADDQHSYKQRNATIVFNNLTELYAHAYKDSLTGSSASEIATKAAAFQFAVWEIIGEGNYSRTAGGLYMLSGDGSTTFNAQVDAYLNALNNDSWGTIGLGATTDYEFTVYASNGIGASQNQLRVTEKSSNVPEPESLLLLLAGVIAMSGSCKSRMKK